MKIAPVRVAGPENIRKIAVIAGTLILVGDMEGNGRARGDALKDAGQNVYRIRFLARRCRGPAAGLAQIKLPLQVFLAQGQACGAAVEYASEPRAMRFSVGGQAQQTPKGIAGHSGSRKELNPSGVLTRKVQLAAASRPALKPHGLSFRGAKAAFPPASGRAALGPALCL